MSSFVEFVGKYRETIEKMLSEGKFSAEQEELVKLALSEIRR